MATFKTAYSKKTRKSFSTTGPSMTKQSFKNECDINTLLKRYQKTGLIDHVNTYQGNYSDISNVPDYHTAMQIVLNASTAFDSLPSEIRRKFDNDPGKFLDFAQNPDNLSEMQELGLAPKQELEQAAPPKEVAPAPEPTLTTE